MQVDQLTSSPLTKDQAYGLVDAVMERDDLALTASAHENEETGEWIFEATCESPPDAAAFAGMRIKPGHRDLRHRDAETLPEVLRHDPHRVDDQFMAQQAGHVAQRHMNGQRHGP